MAVPEAVEGIRYFIISFQSQVVFVDHGNHKVEKTLFQILVSQTEKSFLTRIGVIACHKWGFVLGFQHCLPFSVCFPQGDVFRARPMPLEVKWGTTVFKVLIPHRNLREIDRKISVTGLLLRS